MTFRSAPWHKWIAAGLLLIATAGSVRAQNSFVRPNMDFDAQWFSPVQFDFENLPITKSSGVFFRWNKISWAVAGERTPIGAPGVVALSEEIFPDDAAFDIGDLPPLQYLVQNGVQNVAPVTEFGWGTRYELGFFDDNHGWMMGVIDNQRVHTGTTLGAGPQTSGFGSLHVNFLLDNPGLLAGFRDYNGIINTGAEQPTPTQGGPGVGGNGVSDDLNANLAGFGIFFVDLDGNGMPDPGEVTGIFIDYGDLYNFNVTFNQLFVNNFTRTDGIELMKFYTLDNSHWFVKEQHNQIDVGAGVRFLKIRDIFGWNGTSDLLRGRNFVNTKVDNQIVGPQIYARWTSEYKRWRFGVDGRFMFGYNVQDLNQTGVIGENLLPGDLNQPAILQPTGWAYGKQANDFSPLVELRADAAFQISENLAFKLGYTMIFVDNITRGAPVTRYSLPDMGFNEAGQQHILINGADAGFELVF